MHTTFGIVRATILTGLLAIKLITFLLSEQQFPVEYFDLSHLSLSPSWFDLKSSLQIQSQPTKSSSSSSSASHNLVPKGNGQECVLWSYLRVFKVNICNYRRGSPGLSKHLRFRMDTWHPPPPPHNQNVSRRDNLSSGEQQTAAIWQQFGPNIVWNVRTLQTASSNFWVLIQNRSVPNLNSLEPTSRLQMWNGAVIEFLIMFPIQNLFVVFKRVCALVCWILLPVLKHSQWDIRLHTEEKEEEK